MTTPKEEWNDATTPELKDLQGDFKVTILSGPLLALGKIYKRWEKIINNDLGVNLTDKKRSGYFKITLDDHAVLDYNLPVNNGTWSRLQDHVKEGCNGYFIGKIYFKLWGRYRFMGYFTLTRINP